MFLFYVDWMTGKCKKNHYDVISVTFFVYCCLFYNQEE